MEKHPELKLVDELSSKLKEKLTRRAKESGKYPTLKDGKPNWLGYQTSLFALYLHTKSEYHEMCSKMEIILKLFHEFELTDDEKTYKNILEKLKKRIEELDEESMDLAILSRMTLDRAREDTKEVEEGLNDIIDDNENCVGFCFSAWNE